MQCPPRIWSSTGPAAPSVPPTEFRWGVRRRRRRRRPPTGGLEEPVAVAVTVGEENEVVGEQDAPVVGPAHRPVST